MSHPSFSHEAMATRFEIIVAGQAGAYARQAAAAAFRELDRLESELSRFVETSDIARASRLEEGGSIVLGEDALRCLLDAAQISALTGRAFDPAYASEPNAGGGPLFALDPAGHTLTSLTRRLQLDLGAVGKGYALDCMAGILGEWDIAAACLQSGGSTVLALAAPPGAAGWPVGVEGLTRLIVNRAVSASGLAVQGGHIADPRRGSTAGRSHRVWSFAPSGAEADALSTAFFVMDDDEVAAFCAQHPGYGAVLTLPDGTLRSLGDADSHTTL